MDDYQETSENLLLQAIENTSDHDVLDFYAQSKDIYMRCAVAFNPITPPEILTRLAEDDNEYVLKAVARNKNTQISIRNHLNSKANLELKVRCFEYPEGKVYVYPDGDLWRYGDIHKRSKHAYINIMCALANGLLELKAKVQA